MPALIDPQTKEPVFGVQALEDDRLFGTLKNHPFYSMVLVTKGKGIVVADVSTFAFEEHSLMSFAIYQPFKISGSLEGLWITFHPSFFCLHKHRNEVSCNGVLFNNLYDTPVVNLKPDEMRSLSVIVDQLGTEIRRREQPDQDVLISYLKIFLIEASRAKIEQCRGEEAQPVKTPLTLENLKNAIETHYKTLRSPYDYGELLHISAKALNKACKAHFNKTLTDLIAERLIIEAKRELYLTSKSVKEIAFELGYEDEFYFSRYFKKKVGVSPQIFRDTVGFNALVEHSDPHS